MLVMKKILGYSLGVFSFMLISTSSFAQNVKTDKPVKHKEFAYKVIKKGEAVNSQSEKITLHYINGKVDVRRQEKISINNGKVTRRYMIKPKLERTEEVRK